MFILSEVRIPLLKKRHTKNGGSQKKNSQRYTGIGGTGMHSWFLHACSCICVHVYTFPSSVHWKGLKQRCYSTREHTKYPSISHHTKRYQVSLEKLQSPGLEQQKNKMSLSILFLKTKSESESCWVVSDSLWPRVLSSPWNSLGQNTAVGSHSLLQHMFPTQELNRGLLHCRLTLYQLSYQGIPLKTRKYS